MPRLGGRPGGNGGRCRYGAAYSLRAQTRQPRLVSVIGRSTVSTTASGSRWHRPVANNTIRNRLSRVTTFLRWCVRQGLADPVLVEALCDRNNPLWRVPRLYGKLQGKYPARWRRPNPLRGERPWCHGQMPITSMARTLGCLPMSCTAPLGRG